VCEFEVHTKVVKKSGMPLFVQPKSSMLLGLKHSNIPVLQTMCANDIRPFSSCAFWT
jgi:hypothetical protein